jgi:seryl-tRNA synthetase
MLDLKFIRENPELVKQALVNLNAEAPIEQILDLDARRRDLLTKVEALKHDLNLGSKRIAKAPQQDREALIQETSRLGDEIKAFDAQLHEVEAEIGQLLLLVPNMPHPRTPVGKDESENVVLRAWGKPREFDFEPKPHWELGPELAILDLGRGAKISGSRFFILRGAGAKLERALISFMLDLHVNEHSYTEVWPPYLVRRECMVGTANLPKFADNLYHDEEDDLWLIPTGEVPLTNLFRDEILDADQLPIKQVAYTPCFRREKAAAGKDTRGIKRVRQFNKVELVKHTTPETSDQELERLIRDAEEVLRRLGLCYRVVQMCTGDLSFVACLKYDLEAWAPGCGEWLEVSSCSHFGDFQARRANIRYRTAKGAKPRFVHTLNGSGVALPRTLIALLESYQQADGSVVIPDVLRSYMGGMERITTQGS